MSADVGNGTAALQIVTGLAHQDLPRVSASLRPLSPGDQAVVAHLCLDTEQEQFAGYLDVVFERLRTSRHPEAEHPFAIVAERGIVGFLVLREKAATPDWAPEDVVTLHSFRIGRQHQGRGYGRAGTALAIRWIQASRPEVKRLMLAVNMRNTRARRFYEHCGFTGTGATYSGPIGVQDILSYEVGADRK